VVWRPGRRLCQSARPHPAQPTTGTVTVEWFGWSHYKITRRQASHPHQPFTSNPDSPIKAEDVDKADLIVVADGRR
jgi:hypothetical protein